MAGVTRTPATVTRAHCRARGAGMRAVEGEEGRVRCNMDVGWGEGVGVGCCGGSGWGGREGRWRWREVEGEEEECEEGGWDGKGMF